MEFLLSLPPAFSHFTNVSVCIVGPSLGSDGCLSLVGRVRPLCGETVLIGGCASSHRTPRDPAVCIYQDAGAIPQQSAQTPGKCDSC